MPSVRCGGSRVCDWRAFAAGARPPRSPSTRSHLGSRARGGDGPSRLLRAPGRGAAVGLRVARVRPGSQRRSRSFWRSCRSASWRGVRLAHLAWVRMTLSAIVLALGAGPLLARVHTAVRRGALARDAAVIVGALICFMASAIPALFSARPPPALLVALGFGADGDGASLPGFEAAAGIIVLRSSRTRPARRRAGGRSGGSAERSTVVRAAHRGRRRRPPLAARRPDGRRSGPRARGRVGPRRHRARTSRPHHSVARQGGRRGARSRRHDSEGRRRPVGHGGRPPRPAAQSGAPPRLRYPGARRARAPRRGGGRHRPQWSSVAARGHTIATVALAAFAVIAHGALGAGPASAAAWMAAAAVLVGASSAAFALGAPAAKAMAVARAREAGIVVKDARALEQLAAADVACFDTSASFPRDDASTATSELPDEVRADAAAALRALWTRGVPARLHRRRRSRDDLHPREPTRYPGRRRPGAGREGAGRTMTSSTPAPASSTSATAGTTPPERRGPTWRSRSPRASCRARSRRRSS